MHIQGYKEFIGMKFHYSFTFLTLNMTQRWLHYSWNVGSIRNLVLRLDKGKGPWTPANPEDKREIRPFYPQYCDSALIGTTHQPDRAGNIIPTLHLVLRELRNSAPKHCSSGLHQLDFSPKPTIPYCLADLSSNLTSCLKLLSDLSLYFKKFLTHLCHMWKSSKAMWRFCTSRH